MITLAPLKKMSAETVKLANKSNLYNSANDIKNSPWNYISATFERFMIFL